MPLPPKQELLFHPCPVFRFDQHLPSCSGRLSPCPLAAFSDPPTLALTRVLCTGAEPGLGEPRSGSGLGGGHIGASLWEVSETENWCRNGELAELQSPSMQSPSPGQVHSRCLK